MTHDTNHDSVVGKPSRLVTVREFSTLYGRKWCTPSVLRHLIFDAEPRVGSAGTKIPGNGLGPAIIRIGRKILIDLDRFDDWVESHREGE